MEGNEIVWRHRPTTGVSLNEVLPRLVEFVDAYQGDKSKLMFGYWEYGDEIVVTAPQAGGN